MKKGQDGELRNRNMEHYSITKLRADIKYEDGSAVLDLSGKELFRVPDAATELNEVEELRLNSNNLTKLPATINRLKNLTTLELGSNKISKLPEEIGDLKELKVLSVSDNQLCGVYSLDLKLELLVETLIVGPVVFGSGNVDPRKLLRMVSIPATIQKLIKLEKLDLSTNLLVELPAEIFDLKELTHLRLNNNMLVALPTSIQKLNKLGILELDSNQLTELPSEIGDLKDLRVLTVSKNHLASLPTSIQKMDKLQWLLVGNNKLKKLPDEIGDLKELRVLSVSNEFRTLAAILEKYKFPSGLFAQQMISQSVESRNHLIDVPSSIQNLKNLKQLHLDGNQMKDLPPVISDLRELMVLTVSDNKLISLPTSIQKLNKLEKLHLYGNRITELPPEIGALKKLVLLHVGKNQLVGLPTSVQNLTKLEELYLYDNKITELPPEIGHLKELRLLNVAKNQLVGLPTSMQKLKKLEELYLAHNKLTELLPKIGDLTELKVLRVLGNPLNVDAKRSVLELSEEGKETDLKVPVEIKAQGKRAQVAYQSALKGGSVNVSRARILLIGQDRAGKTSLKKSLIGLPFNPREKSTEGIEVDPSIFQADEGKNWHPIDENKKGLLGYCSKDVAKVMLETLSRSSVPVSPAWILKDKEDSEKLGGDQLQNDHKNGKEVNATDGEEEEDSFLNQVDDPKMDNVSEPVVAGTDRDLAIDTLPPDEIREQVVTLMKQDMKVESVTEETAVSFEVWDFAGQQLYYASHPVFLTSRAIYLLVCNLSKSLHDTSKPSVRQGSHDISLENLNGETNLENLLSWLSTVHSVTEMRKKTCDNAEEKLPHLRPPVIIVGTHADQPYEDIATMKADIQEGIAGKEYEGHVVRPIFSIDNTGRLLQRTIMNKVFRRGKNIDNIQALREKIEEVLKQEPYMGEDIPVRWLNFEKVINGLLSKGVYYLNIEELQTHAKEKCFIHDEDEFTTMVNFYHDLGIIIKHRSTVILSAKWLIDLFGQLITIPDFTQKVPKFAKHWKEVKDIGVLSVELIDHLFSNLLLEGVAREDTLDLMEEFELIVKFSSPKTGEKYFVPSQLKPPPDSLSAMEPSSTDPCPLYVFFVSGFVPHGLFTRLVSRSIRWCSEAGPSQPPTLFQNGAWFVIGKQTVHDFVLLCKKHFIKLLVKRRTQSQVTGDVTSKVALQVREFVESSLQALSRDLYRGGLHYDMRVSCPYCQLEECSGHNQRACSYEDCLHLLELRQDEPLICKKKRSQEVLTVKGQEMWLSHVSEEVYPSTSPVTSQSYPQRSILKVALLSNEWGSSKGGLSTINRTLAIHLAKHADVKVTLIVPQFECGEADRRAAMGHNIYIREAQRRPGFSDPLDWLSFPPKDLDIQVVIGHGAKLGKQAQIIKDFRGCKWTQVVHTEPEELAMHKNYPSAITKGEGKNRAEVELCQLADFVVAVGPKLTDAFSSYLRSSRQDVFQLMPGTFTEFSDVEHTSQGSAKFKVLTFGRGDFEDFNLKGYDIAAQAIVELNDSSYRLIFVGAPDGKQDEVAEILRKTGISKNQLFVRSFVKNTHRLKELFCEVDVAIMPSRTEGFGLTALEAMSAGLPILVSGNSGFGEALRDLPMGESFVIDSDDPKEWAKAIATMQQKSRTQRFEEIQRLRKSYEERFSWERQCQTLVDKMWNMVYGVEKSQKYEVPESNIEEDSTGQMTGELIFLLLQQIKLEARRETSKTELSLNLKRVALEKGFEISDNHGEGNCMFLALSEQLDLVKGVRISHVQLRRTVVQYLKDNPKLPDGTELFHFVDGYSSWEAYLASMMVEGTWGDHVILHGVANCFGTCIHVISSVTHHTDVLICPEHDDTGGNRLVLGHVHELHYVSLIPHGRMKKV